MRLPKEIRHIIYELVILPWDPSSDYPQPKKYSRNWIEVSRRRIKPRMELREIGDPFEKTDAQAYLETRSRYEKRDDRIDYFKESEYRHLEAFLRALVNFEGRQTTSRGRHMAGTYTQVVYDSRKSKERSTGILRDCVDWLWSNIVLDVTVGTTYFGCPSARFMVQDDPIHGTTVSIK